MEIKGNSPIASNGNPIQPEAKNPAATSSANAATYRPLDIRNDELKDLHASESNSPSEIKNPRFANIGMQAFAKVGRVLAGVGAAFCGALTATALFLFSAKIAFLCAIPTLACLAAFIALKPNQELKLNMEEKDVDIIKEVASDQENARPEFILSRSGDLTKALKNLRNAWSSISPDRSHKDPQLKYKPYLNQLLNLEKLKAKLNPIIQAATENKLKEATLDSLKQMREIVDTTVSEIAAFLKTKGVDFNNINA